MRAFTRLRAAEWSYWGLLDEGAALNGETGQRGIRRLVRRPDRREWMLFAWLRVGALGIMEGWINCKREEVKEGDVSWYADRSCGTKKSTNPTSAGDCR